MRSSPVMLTTWPFGAGACETGYRLLLSGARALDAVERAANVTEEDPTAMSVGFGGLPNAEGEVELDAAIMDGPTHSAGAVAGLQRIHRPISVARRVMERTRHVMLVGEGARRFALSQGFREEALLTPASEQRWRRWQAAQTGPSVAHFDPPSAATPDDHDTIGLCALDIHGDLAAGCTTSGLAWKTPGRVGDSPLIGSGLYVDNEVGAAAATGDGDEMMKACLSYRAVMLMEEGASPEEACVAALRYLMRKRPPELHDHYGAAMIALNANGASGAAATRSGFNADNRPWIWYRASPVDGAPVRNEGPYVTAAEVIPHLQSPTMH